MSKGGIPAKSTPTTMAENWINVWASPDAQLKGETFWSIVKSLVGTTEPGEGIQLQVKVRKAVRRRTLPANRRHWAICTQGAEHLTEHGDVKVSPEEFHEAMCLKFLPVFIPVGNDGEFIETRRSSKNLSTIEFRDLDEKIVAWLAQHAGLHIKEPNEQESLYDEC